MFNVKVSPTGKIIHGHVLDCARGPLEATMREYDPQLYVKWNPKKLQGYGCWEVRRRPELKTISLKHVVVFEGNTYITPIYQEYDHIHHIMDVPYLNYLIVERLKKIDTWKVGYKGKNWSKEYEYNEAKHLEGIDNKAAEDFTYHVKQMKREINTIREALASGQSPNLIVDNWK